MVKLSVTIITYNEDKNIERCLKSIENIADEIVVVDSFSTDKTEEICKCYNVNFVKHAFEGHIQQKNYALTLAKYDYILSLDADECLDETLLKSIEKVKESWSKDGYSFNRLTNYCGHWVKHCGWYPDSKLRLLRKRTGVWSGVNPHDKIKMNLDATVSHLEGDLLHYSYDSIEDHINQTNKFTTIAALAAFEAGVKSTIFKAVLRLFFKFFRDFFFKHGILDGKYGVIICYINAMSSFLKYVKIAFLCDHNKK